MTTHEKIERNKRKIKALCEENERNKRNVKALCEENERLAKTWSDWKEGDIFEIEIGRDAVMAQIYKGVFALIVLNSANRWNDLTYEKGDDLSKTCPKIRHIASSIKEYYDKKLDR